MPKTVSSFFAQAAGIAGCALITSQAVAAEFTVSACTLDGVNEVVTFITDDNVAPPAGVDTQQVLQDFWNDYITGVTWEGMLFGGASHIWKSGIAKVIDTLGEDYLLDKTEPIIGPSAACLKL